MDTEKKIIQQAKQLVQNQDKQTEHKLRRAYEQLRNHYHGEDLVYAVAQEVNKK